jgi:type III restriction enzyme
MELKKYQQTVIDDLTKFLALLNEKNSISAAYRVFWNDKKVEVGFGGLPPYNNMLPGVPNVCLKVPTGGGKTFIASCAIKPIFDSLPYSKTKAVVWLVPSDAILEQTIKNLSDPHHPYRQRINMDFSHRVEVYSKMQLLNGQNFNPTTVSEMLSVFVLSYDSFRTSKKEGRKAYQENGELMLFSKYFDNPEILLADTDETALIQVIRLLNPIVIVDESHHANTPLSKEMLTNFNPGFVLDLTATPKKESNIISYVDAIQLKKENMVKLPVIVYNRRSREDVISDAITTRNKLEIQAKINKEQTGRYIRPIVLFQAEPKGNDTTTFDKIKKNLIEAGIPENQIAIKISEKNELRGINLLSEDCQIRYIITINALKEGWDCPFAYVLATVANRTSTVDVEQILGRILRLPYTTKNSNNVLNISYVITSSNNFHETLKRVVKGLNNAGFSDKDYRPGTIEDEPTTTVPIAGTQIKIKEEDDDFSINVDMIKSQLEQQEKSEQSDISEDEIFSQAIQQAEQYEASIQENDNIDYEAASAEVREYMKVFRINEEFKDDVSNVLLPQFVVSREISMFEDKGIDLLTKEELSENFTLRDKDTMIDFSTVDGEIAHVDITDTNVAIPQAWKLTGMDNQFFREWFNSQSAEWRVDHCKQTILNQLSKINSISDKDLSEYVGRIISGLTPEQLEDLQQSTHIYLSKIRKKINNLLDMHREKIFDLWIEQGKIKCSLMYSFKSTISPMKVITILPKTLYAAEEELNGLEYAVAWEIANLPNIKWWHRNISNTGFNINGYINAYPDIIAMTESGKILIIEPKGDHLENEESRQKVKIGRAWQNMAGNNYRYYMVFKDKDLKVDGVVRFDRFMEIVRGL